ncbi:MAG: hypothetical protein WDW38_008686 [Sanguina aurantia]
MSMAMSYQQHCDQALVTLSHLISCVGSLSSVHTSRMPTTHHPQQLHPLQRQLLSTLMECVRLSDDHQPRPATPGTAVGITDLYARLLTTLAKQLQRLDSADPLLVESGAVHWSLWMTLHGSSLAFVHFWPMCQDLDHSALHTALHALMTWMLPHVRGDFHRRHSTNQPKRATDLHIIMKVPLLAFIQMAADPRALSALPLDFLPLLCCIACELFGGLEHETSSAHTGLRAQRPLRPTSNGSSTRSAAGSHTQAAASACHSVPDPDAHFMSALVVAILRSEDVALYGERSCAVLDTLIGLSMAVHMGSLLPRCQVSGTSSTGGACTTTRTASSALRPVSVITDRLLVDTLCKRMRCDRSTTRAVFMVMSTLVQAWATAERHGVVVAHSLIAERNLVAIKLAHQCSRYGQRWMLLAQEQQSQQQQQQQLQQGCHGESRVWAVQAVRSALGSVLSYAHHVQKKLVSRPLRVTPALWYHHTFSTLDVWANMPGSLYSLECLHRGNHRPTSATDICQAVLLGCMMVKAGMAGSCFRSLHALISLVATSRKLLHTLTGSETATPCGQAVRSVNDLELSSKGGVLVQMMSECVAGIGRQLHQQQGGGGASHPPTGTPVAKRRKARLPRLPPGAKTAPSTSNNQAASEDDDPQCVYSPPSTHHLLHQLLAIQVSSVIQLLHWQVRYEGRDVEGTGTRPSLPEIKVSAGFELAVSHSSPACGESMATLSMMVATNH